MISFLDLDSLDDIIGYMLYFNSNTIIVDPLVPEDLYTQVFNSIYHFKSFIVNNKIRFLYYKYFNILAKRDIVIFVVLYRCDELYDWDEVKW